MKVNSSVRSVTSCGDSKDVGDWPEVGHFKFGFECCFDRFYMVQESDYYDIIDPNAEESEILFVEVFVVNA